MSEAAFVRHLRDSGLAVRPRYAAGGREKVQGYSVAIAGAEPVWYGGGRLAKDLTLPSLRASWSTSAGDQHEALAESKRQRPPAIPPKYGPAAVAQTTKQLQRILRELQAVPADDVAGWSHVASHASGVLARLSRRLEGEQPGLLADASDALAGAAQRPAEIRREETNIGKDLRGVAAVAAQAILPGGTVAWLALLQEVRRVTEVLRDASTSRGQASAAGAQAERARARLEAVHAGIADRVPATPDAAIRPALNPLPPIHREVDRGPGFGR